MVPDSKVHGANMGPTWVLPAPDGPHVGPMQFAIRGDFLATKWVKDPKSQLGATIVDIVVIMTTSGATSDEKVDTMTTCLFKWPYPIGQVMKVGLSSYLVLLSTDSKTR